MNLTELNITDSQKEQLKKLPAEEQDSFLALFEELEVVRSREQSRVSFIYFLKSISLNTYFLLLLYCNIKFDLHEKNYNPFCTIVIVF